MHLVSRSLARIKTSTELSPSGRILAPENPLLYTYRFEYFGSLHMFVFMTLRDD